MVILIDYELTFTLLIFTFTCLKDQCKIDNTKDENHSELIL